jgi:hypothetical protein
LASASYLAINTGSANGWVWSFTIAWLKAVALSFLSVADFNDSSASAESLLAALLVLSYDAWNYLV